jgi:DNA-3-methyladenine glycosylase
LHNNVYPAYNYEHNAVNYGLRVFVFILMYGCDPDKYTSLICPEKSFYSRPTQLVARELIGKKLVRLIGEVFCKRQERLAGTIIETEAYGHTNDPASHAYKGLTSRNMPMFGQVGSAYIYFIYGSNFCMNVSAYSDKAKAGAVLIRALQPCEGVHIMKRLRNCRTLYDLTSGPGKICQAMDINRSLNSLDMTDPKSEIHIEFGEEDDTRHVVATKRIGLKYATGKQWRFVRTSAN